MLMTVSDFREKVRHDIDGLIDCLKHVTGRDGEDEVQAWRSSLPKLADAFAAPQLAPLHLYFAGAGYMALEYQLPAASSWCDAVLLGQRQGKSAAVVVELKDWVTRGDRPGPAEGLMERGGMIALHPSDQVRGYVEYCRRFHSAVQQHSADVRGCVLFTRDRFVDRYAEPPNDQLTADYPCFTMAPAMVHEALPRFLVERLISPDIDFARDFVEGRYVQDRGFIRQVGEQILDPAKSPFELLDNQRRAFSMTRARIDDAVFADSVPRKQVILIQGPPGTGKSVLAARLWAALVTDDRLPEGGAVMVATSTAQTSNWSSMFKRAARTSGGHGIVKRAAGFVPVTTHEVGRLRKRLGRDFVSDPDAWRQNVQLLRNLGIRFQDGARDDQYLISVVDEAHALINPEHSEGRGQFGFAPTLGPLGWHIIRSSTVSIFLLDPAQGFRDRENTSVEDIQRWACELGAEVVEPISLEGAQFRCAGSAEFVEWVEAVLHGDPPERAAELARRWRQILDFRLVDSPAELEAALRAKVEAGRTARLVASYARKWKTKGAAHPQRLPPEMQDFHEPYIVDGRKAYWSRVWNYLPDGSDYTWFIQAPVGSPMHDDPLAEVGCPYVVRGFDFDYIGVLWLGDLVYRRNGWQVDVTHVHDTGLSNSLRAARRGSNTEAGRRKLARALAQAYRVLLTRGILGCYLWVEDAETRQYLVRCMGE